MNDNQPDDMLESAQQWVAEVEAAYADGGYAAGDNPNPPLDEMQWLLAEVERLAAALRARDADLAIAQRERDSLARRCAARFEETEVDKAVAARLLNGWTADSGMWWWWRNSGRTSEPMSDAERAWLMSVSPPASEEPE